MKLVILAIMFFTGLNAIAYTPYSESECNKPNVVDVDISVSFDQFEPRIIYLKENDKVCFKVTAIDVNISMSLEKHPMLISARANKTTFTYLKIGKKGEYKFKCNGCAYNVNPKVVVQSKEEFEKFDEEKLREESNTYRKKLKDQPKQKKALTEDELYYLQRLKQKGY